MALNGGLGDDVGFGVKPAEVLIYAVDDNYSLGLAPTSVIPVVEGTTTLTNAIFTAGNNTVVISANSFTGQQLYAYNISSASLQELPYHAGGNLRLENDGRIYASVAGTSTILAINTNLTTGFNLTLADTSLLTGHLAQQVFKVMPAGDENHALYARSAGLKKYELKDHLGNVRVVVSDRLTASGALPNITNDAELLSYNHYYPFGMLQPGRNYAANTYRYGFGGMEKDDEISGSTGTNYDFGARMYDSRLGKWWSVDPLQQRYPSMSPYIFAANNPVFLIDSDGEKIFVYYQVEDNNGNIINKSFEYGSGLKLPKDKYVRKAVRTLNKIERKGFDKFGIIEGLSKSEEKHVAITELKNWHDIGAFIIEVGQGTVTDMNGNPIDGYEFPPDVITWHPNSGYIDEYGNNRQSSAVGLLHELGHPYYYILDPYGKEFWLKFMSNVLTTEEAEEEMKIFIKTREKEVGDYHTYSDKWIISEVEPAFKQGTRQNHKDGYFLKTKGSPFSSRGRMYGKRGETGKVRDLKEKNKE